MSWNFPPRRGGIEEMASQLSSHLRELTEVTVLTGRASRTTPPRPGVDRSPLPGLLGFLVWSMVRTGIALLRRDPPVVLSAGALVGSCVEWVARLLRRPHVVLLFGSDVTYPSRLYQGWLRWRLRSVPRMLTISAAVDRELAARGLAVGGRIERLTPGVDPAIVDAPYDEALEAPSVPVLLFVGRVIERKGLQPFVEHCLPKILERRAVELWVVGGEALESLAHRPGVYARLREHVDGSPLASQVRFFGRASDEQLRAIYRIASVLVLPAIEIAGDIEGFGIVFLEAAVFGVPAVSSRLGGIPDAVEDGRSGVLLQPGDWEAYATTLVELLTDRERYSYLSAEARRRAIHDYDWRLISARCLRLLESTSRD